MDEDTILEDDEFISTDSDHISVDGLTTLAAEIVNTNKSEAYLAPEWVANEVMRRVDPRRVSLPAVYGGCNLYIRQVARSLLREKFELQETCQHELWPELQWRYPTKPEKSRKPVYVLLELMSAADIAYNVERLRKEANAKEKHADALERWGWSHFPETKPTIEA